VDQLIDTGFVVVYPWQCDQMGHLSTRFYSAFFDDACYFLLASIGYVPETAFAESWGWVDATSATEYCSEVRSGSLLAIRSRIAGIGNSSLVEEHIMTHVPTGNIAAKMKTTAVCFDLKLRQSRRVPDHIRAQIQEQFGICQDSVAT
jgi:acyl-CoA thioester hydrolase